MRMNKDEYYLNIAAAVALRSTCLKRRYGAVIVQADEIIATGYNGNPRGSENCCDRGSCSRMNEPHNSGDYSNCFSVHAEQNAMLAAQRRDMIGATLYLAGDEYVMTDPNDGSFIYDWCELEDASPCPICKRMILNAGIKRIVSKGGELCL